MRRAARWSPRSPRSILAMPRVETLILTPVLALTLALAPTLAGLAPLAPRPLAAQQATSPRALAADSAVGEALRSTLAMAEVLAGYVHGQAARGALRETQKASFALDLATRLIASTPSRSIVTLAMSR